MFLRPPLTDAYLPLYPVETEKLPCSAGVPLAGVSTSSRSPDANATPLLDPVPVVFPAAMEQVSVVLAPFLRSVYVTALVEVPSWKQVIFVRVPLGATVC
jgi:hypothetical protein